MRICHVIEALGGGGGQVVVDLAKAGHAAGDEITVIYAPERTEEKFVQTLSALPNLKLIITPMSRAVGLHDLWDAIELYRTLRKADSFDIIHGHSSKGGALARLAGLLFPRAVKIYTPHAFVTMDATASPVYGWVEWLLSWLCQAIIVVSQQEKEHALRHLKIPQEKLHVIWNGIDLHYPADRATARQHIGFADDAYLVGFVGRLVPQKNPDRLIKAFALVAQQKPNARLAIIGSGCLQSKLEDAIKQNDLTNRVRLFSDTNARDLMPGFDCLLCTSDYESFGLIFPEALNAGIPVVTTPVGVAEQAVTANHTGIVTADFSAQALASGVCTLAQLNAQERAEMSAKCHTNAQQFDSQSMAKTTRSLYTAMIA